VCVRAREVLNSFITYTDLIQETSPEQYCALARPYVWFLNVINLFGAYRVWKNRWSPLYEFAFGVRRHSVQFSLLTTDVLRRLVNVRNKWKISSPSARHNKCITVRIETTRARRLTDYSDFCVRFRISSENGASSRHFVRGSEVNRTTLQRIEYVIIAV